MDLIAQICVLGVASASAAILGRQLPGVTALRWWTISFLPAGLGVILRAASFQFSAPLQLSCIAIAVACGCMQIGLLARGALCLQGARQKWTYAVPAGAIGVLLAPIVLNWLAGPSSRTAVALEVASELIVPVVCVVLALYVWRSSSSRSVKAAIVVLLGSCAISTVVEPTVARVFPELSATVLAAMNGVHTFSEIFAQCATVLAVTCLAVGDAGNRNARMLDSARRLHSLVGSTDCGICQIDTSGCITFANREALLILTGEDTRLPHGPIHELLHPCDEESTRLLSDMALRPTTTVAHAKARVLRRDGETRTVEWSSRTTVSGTRNIGAVITLQDITQREASENFTDLRSKVTEMIARNEQLEEVLNLLAMAVETRLSGFTCSVLVCQGDCFRVVAAPTAPDVLRAAMEGLHYSRLAEPSGRNAGHGRRGWSESLRSIASKQGFLLTWTEPVISAANELLGAIVANGTASGRLSLGERETVKEAARLAALAIDHRRSLERLLHQGHHDALTGLPNRLLLSDRLKHALARAARGKTQLALMCIDLDRFKQVNDMLGHDIGDLFLQQISVRLATRIRSSDTLARTGGDEFTAILTDLHDVQDAGRVAESLLAALNEPFEVDGHVLYGAASIGIALYPQDGADAETLHRSADRAMYRAKARGRNSIQYYSCKDARESADRIEIEVQLHRALEQGNFALEFQPQFTCNHQLAGFEALLRFRHPKLGMVPPTRFIPIAEESGLILPIGEWVLNEACRQVADWQSKGMRVVRVAVNVSPLQFARPDFCQAVERALRTSKLRPELLELELTEGVLISNMHDTARQVEEIAKLGVRLAVDDFGTGYSSLSYLHQLPIHMLKIDRSFVAKMQEQVGTRSIVEAIISLAHGLRLQTVAEGVETEQQLAILQAANCDLVQGFLFARPLSVVEASCILWQHTMSVLPLQPASREQKTWLMPASEAQT